MRVDANRTLKTKKLVLGTWATILAAAGGEDAQLPVRMLQTEFKHKLSFMTHKVSFNSEILSFLKLN